MTLAKRLAVSVAFAALVAVPGVAVAQTAMTAAQPAGPPAGKGNYADLTSLFTEFLAWRDASPIVGELTSSSVRVGVNDYDAATVQARRAKMQAFLARMQDMNVASWDQPKQADWLAVRSVLQQHNFMLNVSKPWERDPGFYVDQMLAITFIDLPLKGDKLKAELRDLRAVPVLVEAAKRNLKNVPGDYADLALHNLSAADGVGHGHPYRAVPPAGVIGWYDDLLARVSKEQPALRKDVEAARAATLEFQRWLKEQRPTMTASAGVGDANFDWYLKNAKLLPYTSKELLTLGHRELERLWSVHALEQHRNRKLPQIEPVKNQAEYDALVERTGDRVKKFLIEEEIITIPSFMTQFKVNTPFIERPTGRNFWEEIQFRDPSPDYFHATLPGHSFDGQYAKHSTHPIRSKIADGVRTEGWGVYLEEGAQRLGFFEDIPRVREFIDLFGIFRAVRVIGDVNLQTNRATLQQTIDNWRSWTPWLDADVARVDAEIYLRRPPGYGLGYTVGMIEMQKLLADRKHQLRDKFVLKDFHDKFMETGRLPMSLIRWEMTGLDNEVRNFWTSDPLPPQN